MSRPSLDAYYAAMIPLVASRGTCPRRQVACILVDNKGRLVAVGYNGTASGLPHCSESPCPGSPILAGERSSCEAVHAEINALAQASASRRQPHTAYCSLTPCRNCAAALVTFGIKTVIALDEYKHDGGAGPLYLTNAHVQVYTMKMGEKRIWIAQKS